MRESNLSGNACRLCMLLSLLFCLISGATVGWMVEFVKWSGLIIIPFYAILCAEIFRRIHARLVSLVAVLIVFLGALIGRVSIAVILFFRDSSITAPYGIFTPIKELYSPSIFPLALLLLFMGIFYISLHKKIKNNVFNTNQ